jgi:hypothetical protein
MSFSSQPKTITQTYQQDNNMHFSSEVILVLPKDYLRADSFSRASPFAVFIVFII